MTTPAWQTAALQPDLHVRFALLIEGIPYVFLDGAIPTAPDGTEWPQIPSGYSVDYTWLEHALDTDAGPLKDPGAQVTRSKAETSSASMLFVLRDDRDWTLRTLFARFRTTLLSTLAADVARGGGSVDLELDSDPGWSVGDLVYMGRETLEVTSIAGTTLTCDRNAYDTLGDGDTSYSHQPSRPGAPRTIAGSPRSWHGRYVRLIAFVTDATGTAYDAELDLTFPATKYAWEAWRGVGDGNPIAGADGLSWEIRATSVEHVLTTSVGLASTPASLLRVAGSLAQNIAGTVPKPEGMPANQALVYVSEDVNALHYTVVAYATAADAQQAVSPTATYDHTSGTALGWGVVPTLTPRTNLQLAWSTIADEVDTDTSSDLSLTLTLGPNGRAIVKASATGTTAYRITFYWDLAGSAGPLLGFVGTTFMVAIPGHPENHQSTEPPLGLYLPKTAAYLPVYFDAAPGGAVVPSGAGYARIGSGESAEIVAYDDVVAVPYAGDDLSGVYQLTGVRRGLFGTTPTEVRLALEDAEAADEAKVTFGVGFERTNAFEAILQLAISTGTATRGTYDTLGAGVGSPIRPAHFDLAAFEEAATRFTPEETTLDVFIAKPVKLSELVSQWLAPMGRYLIASTGTDGLYRVRVAEVGAPIEASAITITDADVSARSRVQWRPGAAEVINEVKASYQYNNRDDDWDEAATVTVHDKDSAEEYGPRAGVEWRLRGLRLDPAAAYDLVLHWAQSVFMRYGRPYELPRVPMGRLGWFLRPGQTVRLQLSAVPDLAGASDFDALATVLQAAKVYTGDEVGAVVDLVVETPTRVSEYAPCARITAYDGGAPSITLSTDQFSATSRPDHDWFEVGDVLWVYRKEGDASTRVQRTIVAKSGAVCTLSGTLSLGTLGVTLVTFADYGSIAARQRAWAYVTPNLGEFAAAPTAGYRYA